MDEYTKQLHDLLSRIIRKATTPLSDGGIDWDDVTSARALLAAANTERKAS